MSRLDSKRRLLKAKIKERAEARAKKIAFKRQYAIDQQSATQEIMFEDSGESPEKILEQVLEDRKEREAFESVFKDVGASQDVSLNDLFTDTHREENFDEWRSSLFGESKEESSIFERGAYSDDDIPF